MQTSEVLNRAADLIEERGWVKGTSGWRENGPLCLEGGIMAALALRQGNFAAGTRGGLYQCEAYHAVVSYLGRNPQPADAPVSDALWGWNDDQSSAEPVIEVLRAAALVEAARETELARADA